MSSPYSPGKEFFPPGEWVHILTNTGPVPVRYMNCTQKREKVGPAGVGYDPRKGTCDQAYYELEQAFYTPYMWV